MSIPKLPFSFSTLVKYPLQAVVYILLAYFVYKEFSRGDDCADLRTTTEAQAKRIESLEKKIDDLTWSIAVKSGIIDRLKSQRDSVKTDQNENIK